MRITRRPKFDDDLFAIWRFIAADAPGRADSFLDSLQALFELLATSPQMGVARLKNFPQLRIYPYRDYILLYRPLADGVELWRIIHGARDYAQAFAHEEPAAD